MLSPKLSRPHKRAVTAAERLIFDIEQPSRVRYNSINAFVELGGTDALTALEGLTEDPDAKIRQFAVKASQEAAIQETEERELEPSTWGGIKSLYQ